MKSTSFAKAIHQATTKNHISSPAFSARTSSTTKCDTWNSELTNNLMNSTSVTSSPSSSHRGIKASFVNPRCIQPGCSMDEDSMDDIIFNMSDDEENSSGINFSHVSRKHLDEVSLLSDCDGTELFSSCY